MTDPFRWAMLAVAMLCETAFALRGQWWLFGVAAALAVFWVCCIFFAD